MMTQQIEQIVSDFAKQHKFSKPKALALAQAVMAAVPERRGTGAGKPVIEESQRVRALLREFAAGHKGESFSVVQMREHINAPVSILNNNIRALAKDGVFASNGHAEVAPGQRGRKPILWQVM